MHCWSKSRHRQYGPKVTILDRKITFSRPWGKGTQQKVVDLNSWAGNFVLNSLVKAGLAPKKPKTPLSVRLHKAYDAKLIKTIRGYKIYQRTLLNEPVDYVILAPMGTTYHSEQYKQLFKGLFAKIRAAKRKVNLGDGLIDWSLCKKLGFCDDGIKAFCNEFDFDYKKAYTPREVESAVRRDLEKAAPFMAELKVLAEAFNHSIKEF